MTDQHVARPGPTIDEWTVILQHLREARLFLYGLVSQVGTAARITKQLAEGGDIGFVHRVPLNLDSETRQWLFDNAARYKADSERMAKIIEPMVARLDDLIAQSERTRGRLYRGRRKQHVAEKRFLKDGRPSSLSEVMRDVFGKR